MKYRFAAYIIFIFAVFVPCRSHAAQSPLAVANLAIENQCKILDNQQEYRVEMHVIPIDSETINVITPQWILQGGTCNITVSEYDGTVFEKGLETALKKTILSNSPQKTILDCRIGITFYDSDENKTLSISIDPSGKLAKINGSVVHINDSLTTYILHYVSPFIE